jgi:hypothetical protein
MIRMCDNRQIFTLPKAKLRSKLRTPHAERQLRRLNWTSGQAEVFTPQRNSDLDKSTTAPPFIRVGDLKIFPKAFRACILRARIL